LRVAAGLLGILVGAGALSVSLGSGRFTTYAGSSAAAAALTFAVGISLAVAGLTTSLGRRGVGPGDLALMAVFTWFAPVWVGWQEGPPLVRSLGAALVGFTLPLVFHLAMVYPGARFRSSAVRALVVVVYVEAAATSLVLALFRDPYFDSSCYADCTSNAFLVRSFPTLVQAAEASDRWLVAGAGALLAAICVARLSTGSRPNRHRLVPVAVPAIVIGCAVTARVAVLATTGNEDPFNALLFSIFVADSLAIMLLAAGLVVTFLRTEIEQRAVARIVANLDEAPTPGDLQSALMEALGDRELQIAYWLPESKTYVDSGGRAVPEPALESTSGRIVTRLTRNQRTIGAISHAGTAPELEDQFGPAIRLGLENERLQAAVLAQLGELRASRARIVETGDAERRRLERDLHDGAQQRLLALSYDIRLARASAKVVGDTATEKTLVRATEETQGVLEELRELARGIFPAALGEVGLASALATLADLAPLPVDVRCADDYRDSAAVEAAAYFSVVEAVEDATRRGAGHVEVTVAHHAGRLMIVVEDNGAGRESPMVALVDRVGALGGQVLVEPMACRMEIPCA